MAFQSFFKSKLVEPLVMQIMGVLQRDMSTALAAIDPTLATIAEWNIAHWPVQQWPALMLAVKGERFHRPSEVQARPQEVSMEVHIALASQDRNLLAQQAFRYILAVDQIISSLGAQVNASDTPNFNDFYTPLSVVIPFPQKVSQSPINVTTSGMQAGSVLGCWPTGITYSDFIKSTNNLELLVSEQFLVTVEET
jgi:hypothetical protein